MKRLLPLVLLAGAPGFAAAQDFDYAFVDIGFVDTEIDVGPFDLDGDGFAIAGSYPIADNLFVIGGYSDQDYDFGVDGSVLNAGIGFNTGLGDNLDFVADISYLDSEVGNQDESGYGIRAGVRGRVRPDLELEGGLTLVDLDDSDTGFRGVARYYFSDMFAVSGTLADSDDGTSLTIGVRIEFGDR